MDVPIWKIDIEYLIDAAEKTFCVEGIPEYISYRHPKEAGKTLKEYTEELESRIFNATYGIFEISETDAAERTYIESHRYISYILFKEAGKTLEKFMYYQSLLIDPAENKEDYRMKTFIQVFKELKSRKDKGLKRLTGDDFYIPECPEDYRYKSIIQVLVKFYRKYNEDNRIDEIRQEDEKHKKWSILSEANYQVLEDRSAMRERILTTSRALRTVLKMICRVERGDTPEEVFIRKIGIPEKTINRLAGHLILASRSPSSPPPFSGDPFFRQQIFPTLILQTE